MKICLMGSAPSSIALAPFGDPEWKIYGCSPGLYASVPRVDAWFEMHRWEPPVIGKPHLQKAWFSPEYVAWMAGLKCPVWMFQKVPEIPTSDAYPVDLMVTKFGNYFMTSSLSWMFAMAIDQILLDREKNGERTPWTDKIALYGVDMSATEEWGYQRAGCHFFANLAHNLGIEVVVPPESDLLRPMPLYAISESSHYVIKTTKRLEELNGRLAFYKQQMKQAEMQVAFLEGAIDDTKYHLQTWHSDAEAIPTNVGIWARSPFLNPPPPADVST